MTSNNSLEYQLFDWVCKAVCAEGGDGNALIVSKSYKELAELFDKWRQNNSAKNYFKEEDVMKYILFTDRSNENIIFTSKYNGNITTDRMNDIIVRWF